MAQSSIYGLAKTFKASADLSAKQYLFMVEDAEGTCTTAGTASEFVIGVLQNKPEQNKAARVRIEGTTKLISGDTISVGNYIATDANGKGVPITPATSGTVINHIRGVALTAASAADKEFEIHLINMIALTS